MRGGSAPDRSIAADQVNTLTHHPLPPKGTVSQ